jgi:hypothetical protein
MPEAIYPGANSVFNALNEQADIVSYAQLINSVVGNDGASTGAKALRPELFYTKQLLETIRLGADQYPYFRLAETSPIPDKSMKLQLRRWAPLQAHTTPLVEGIPPKSDKGSVETYEIDTAAYGRFMEFTDRVELDVVDPVIATYTKEYSIVAVETLDLLAREALISVAQQDFANQAANIKALRTFESEEINSKPSIADLRLIVLSMKKALVRPRLNGKFQVICSPEFVYDMITDPYVEKYMQYNNSTKTMYDTGALVPMFDMEFSESMATLNSGEFVDANSKRWIRLYRYNAEAEQYEYLSVREDFVLSGTGANAVKMLDTSGGYVTDSRTGKEASYLPERHIWNIDLFNATPIPSGAAADEYISADSAGIELGTPGTRVDTNGTWQELKIHHCIIAGKEALIRTGMSGQDNAKMYVKAKGSTGVLDPIDQRQSIGFKINSVGFGSARPEAVHDYLCVPSTLNL